MVALKGKGGLSLKIIRSHFLQTRNVCTEIEMSTKSVGFVLWGPGIFFSHRAAVEIFQSGPNYHDDDNDFHLSPFVPSFQRKHFTEKKLIPKKTGDSGKWRCCWCYFFKCHFSNWRSELYWSESREISKTDISKPEQMNSKLSKALPVEESNVPLSFFVQRRLNCGEAAASDDLSCKEIRVFHTVTLTF